MESLNPSCTPLKKEYDGCFQQWHKEFIKNPEKFVNFVPCEDLFIKYQNCLQGVVEPLQKDIDQAREHLESFK